MTDPRFAYIGPKCGKHKRNDPPVIHSCSACVTYPKDLFKLPAEFVDPILDRDYGPLRYSV